MEPQPQHGKYQGAYSFLIFEEEDEHHAKGGQFFRLLHGAQKGEPAQTRLAP